MPRRGLQHRGDDPLALAALALALGALCSGPGCASSTRRSTCTSTRSGFLRDVARAWTPTGDLGHVFGGQYGGYLLPMGPFFALGDALGLPDVDRAPAVARAPCSRSRRGASVRLLDELLGRPRGARHASRRALYRPQPVRRRLREPDVDHAARVRGAAVAAAGRAPRAARPARLVVAGGVRARADLDRRRGERRGHGLAAARRRCCSSLYEPALGGVAWRAARAFAGVRPRASRRRVAVVGGAGARARALRPGLPAVHRAAGDDLGHDARPESLRLMGFWTSYIGVGFGGGAARRTSPTRALLFSRRWSSRRCSCPRSPRPASRGRARWRYAPFFLAPRARRALLVMFAGFPEGTPLRRGADVHLQPRRRPSQFLRTTYKAGPLVALGLAGLGGARRAALRRGRGCGGRARRLAARGRAALAALSRGRLAAGARPALDAPADLGRRPRRVGRTRRDDLDRRAAARRARDGAARASCSPSTTGAGRSTRSCPRSPSGRWRCASSCRTPTCAPSTCCGPPTRSSSRSAPCPGQLAPLLRPHGRRRGGRGRRRRPLAQRRASPPARPRARSPRGGLGAPDARTARRAGAQPRPATLEPPRRAARRSAATTSPTAAGMVRVEPRRRRRRSSTARRRARRPRRLRRAATPTAAALRRRPRRGELRAAARERRRFVISDSNRRRVFVAARLRAERGLDARRRRGAPRTPRVLDPFGAAGRRPDRRGHRRRRAPCARRSRRASRSSPSTGRSPRSTATRRPRGWPPRAPTGPPLLEVDLHAPRDVPTSTCCPTADAPGRVDRVAIGGRRVRAATRAGTGCASELRGARALRVRIARVDRRRGCEAAPAASASCASPACGPARRCARRVLLEHALRGADLRAPGLTYLFERTTGDDPFRRASSTGARRRRGWSATAGPRGGRSRARSHRPRRARSRVDAWATRRPDGARPSARRARPGTRGGAFDSSGRFEGRPGRRASRRSTATAATAWIAPWDGERGAWLAGDAGRERDPARCSCGRPCAVRPRPERVRARPPTAGRPPPLAVGRRRQRRAPAPLRGRAFRLEVLAARFPAGTPGRDRQRRAVGIAGGPGAGARAAAVARRGALIAAAAARCACAAGARMRLRPVGSVAASTPAGRCARGLRAGARAARRRGGGHDAARALFAPDRLRLPRRRRPGCRRRPAAAACSTPAALGRREVDGVRLDARRPEPARARAELRPRLARVVRRRRSARRGRRRFANGWPVDRPAATALRLRARPPRSAPRWSAPAPPVLCAAVAARPRRRPPSGRRRRRGSAARRPPARLPWGRAPAHRARRPAPPPRR